MMAVLDAEASSETIDFINAHLVECADCKAVFDEFKQMKEDTMRLRDLLAPDQAWGDYWGSLYNRLERGIAWFFIAIGSVILGGFALYHAVMSFLADSVLPGYLKFAIFSVIFGLILLSWSVIREKLATSKNDPYKGVQR